MRAWERATQALRDTTQRRRQKIEWELSLLTRQADTSRTRVGDALGAGGYTVWRWTCGEAGA
eukprot:3840759-Rhodomonas_salina.2